MIQPYKMTDFPSETLKIYQKPVSSTGNVRCKGNLKLESICWLQAGFPWSHSKQICMYIWVHNLHMPVFSLGRYSQWCSSKPKTFSRACINILLTAETWNFPLEPTEYWLKWCICYARRWNSKTQSHKEWLQYLRPRLQVPFLALRQLALGILEAGFQAQWTGDTSGTLVGSTLDCWHMSSLNKHLSTCPCSRFYEMHREDPKSCDYLL